MKIGIIGSCGKNGTIQKRINSHNYESMINKAKDNIKRLTSSQNNAHDANQVTLISGGASLSDHIAVELFNEDFVGGLILHFPCTWDEINCKFEDNGCSDWRKNNGKLTNDLHEQFSTRLRKNSLSEIQMAMDKGAQVFVGKNYWDRNMNIAKECDALIAFTFDKTMTPGTKYTWNACKVEPQLKIHNLIANPKVDK